MDKTPSAANRVLRKRSVHCLNLNRRRFASGVAENLKAALAQTHLNHGLPKHPHFLHLLQLAHSVGLHNTLTRKPSKLALFLIYKKTLN